jgi:hypothetical protein
MIHERMMEVPARFLGEPISVLVQAVPLIVTQRHDVDTHLGFVFRTQLLQRDVEYQLRRLLHAGIFRILDDRRELFQPVGQVLGHNQLGREYRHFIESC